MIASLPMYARASNTAAHDALWALIRDGLRDRGIDAPDALDHEIDHKAAWARDDLVLGHICNLPYRKQFRDQLTLVGASNYGLEGCRAGHYRSHFVVRADDPATDPVQLSKARFVCNDTLSHSGYGSAQAWALDHGFTFDVQAQTGSHHASINAVARGDADIAAIDALSWRIEMGENPQTKTLKIIGHTGTSPGMSFVTRKGQNPAPYFAAIDTAINALPANTAAILGLKGIVALPQSAYDMPFPPEAATNPA